MDFKNKVVFIAGGAGDIGEHTANGFLKSGAKVVLFDFNKTQLINSCERLKEFKDRILTIEGNASKLLDMLDAVEYTLRIYGTIDILVNCAGIARHFPIDEMTLEAWEQVIEVNLTGIFTACKAVVPVMKKNKYGKIVSIASLGGRTGRPVCGVNYAASKAGVIGLTMCLAYELGPDNICVNAVAPGPLLGRMTKTFPPEKLEELKKGVRIDRLGTPNDIAAAILFLSSDDASWITGEVIDINGGLYY